MESEPTKADVESRLNETAEAMSERVASIQEEVTATGVSLRDWIANNPVKSVGGMLAAGLALGVLFGGGRSARHRRHDELVDRYLDALRAEVEEAVDRGEEPGPALEKALRDRVPMVVYTERGAGRRGRGRGRRMLGEAAEIIFSTGLSLLSREAIGSLLDTLDVEGLVDEQMPDA